MDPGSGIGSLRFFCLGRCEACEEPHLAFASSSYFIFPIDARCITVSNAHYRLTRTRLTIFREFKTSDNRRKKVVEVTQKVVEIEEKEQEEDEDGLTRKAHENDSTSRAYRSKKRGRKRVLERPQGCEPKNLSTSGHAATNKRPFVLTMEVNAKEFHYKMCRRGAYNEP